MGTRTRSIHLYVCSRGGRDLSRLLSGGGSVGLMKFRSQGFRDAFASGLFLFMFGIVPADSPHANSRAATEARTRDARRRRVRELIRAGVHYARDRQQILRAEDTASGRGGHHSDNTADAQTSPQRNTPPSFGPQTTRATRTRVGANLPMMRTFLFLPSTLSQPVLPNAIQLLGLSNVDLSEEGASIS